MFPWLQHNWLALCSFVVSASAFAISYKKYKHDTRPRLIIRQGPAGLLVENVGAATAVWVSLRILQRTKRASSRLHVEDVLKVGESSEILAFDYPDDVRVEVLQNTLGSMEEFVLLQAGQDVQPTGGRVAAYLLTRNYRQIVVLRFGGAAEWKRWVRLFSVRNVVDGRGDLVPSNRLLSNRFCVSMLEKRYAANAQYAPPFSFADGRQEGNCHIGR